MRCVRDICVTSTISDHVSPSFGFRRRDGFVFASFFTDDLPSFAPASTRFNSSIAEAAIRSAHADLVSFGTPYIANPDLTERFRRRASLSAGNRATYYGGGAPGYTDYATLEMDAIAAVAVSAGAQNPS